MFKIKLCYYFWVQLYACKGKMQLFIGKLDRHKLSICEKKGDGTLI